MTGFMRRFPAASAASAASAAPAAAAAAACFLALLLQGEASRSQPPALPKVVEDSLDRKFNTEADAVILEESRVVTLGKNGEVKERTRIVQKMLTDFGVDEYCDPRILYNAAHQKLTVIEASTFMLDGKKVVTGDNGKNQATPDAMATFPHYCDVQEMIVSHVGVEVGGVTVLEYEIEDRKPWRKFFYGLEPFTEERDIESKVLELRVPAGMKLEWKALHFNPEVVKVPGGEQDVYTFRAGNIKGMNLHEGGGKPAQTLPCLFYSEKMDEKTLSRAVMGSAHGFDGSMSKEEEGKVKDMIKAIDGEIADKMVPPRQDAVYLQARGRLARRRSGGPQGFRVEPAARPRGLRLGVRGHLREAGHPVQHFLLSRLRPEAPRDPLQARRSREESSGQHRRGMDQDQRPRVLPLPARLGQRRLRRAAA
jgi:hypothetical protein